MSKDIMKMLEGFSMDYKVALRDYLDRSIASSSLSELEDLPDNLPNLKVKPYIMLTFAEFQWISFIEELFSNYSDDYRLSDPDELSNDNSVIVTNNFAETNEKLGQKPQVIVQANGSQMNAVSVGNMDPNTNETPWIRDRKIAQKSMSIRITVVTGNYNETNILANIIQAAIVENHDILRKLFSYGEISFPSMQGAQKTREYSKAFASVVDFQVMTHVKWSNLVRLKTYKNLIFRLRAKATESDPEPIDVIMSKVNFPLDGDLEDFLRGK